MKVNFVSAILLIFLLVTGCSDSGEHNERDTSTKPDSISLHDTSDLVDASDTPTLDSDSWADVSQPSDSEWHTSDGNSSNSTQEVSGNLDSLAPCATICRNEGLECDNQHTHPILGIGSTLLNYDGTQWKKSCSHKPMRQENLPGTGDTEISSYTCYCTS